ncbi:MAG: NHL repeat-containing protein [Ignavibacteria bacterium]|nr:NHL repeat-containing protein [Ignavibacteria bacterium]MBI3764951.1 NHL repeat-containing protein [Ignavibacteriales bacterium]
MVKSIFTIGLVVLLSYGAGSWRNTPIQERPKYGAFHRAIACASDPAANIYVLDAGSSEIVKFSAQGEELGRVGSFGWAELSFDHPSDLIAPNGLDVYVADYGNHRIQRFDRNLNFVSTLTSQTDEGVDKRFAYPRSVGSSRLGALFFVDGDNKRILKLDVANNIERSFGGIDASAGRLTSPSKVRVSEGDIVYVQDGNTLVLFDVFGNFLRTISDSAIRGLRSFTVDHHGLYLLDSNAVYTLDEDHLSEKSTKLLTKTFESDSNTIVDLSVNGNEIILLRERDFIIVHEDSSASFQK